jgi:hypothetical protein
LYKIWIIAAFFYWFDLPKASQKVPGLGSFATCTPIHTNNCPGSFHFLAAQTSKSLSFCILYLQLLLSSMVKFLKIFFGFLSVGKKQLC